jgi:hypothetical protein
MLTGGKQDKGVTQESRPFFFVKKISKRTIKIIKKFVIFLKNN